jgi:ArsR family transcriptional regulator
VDKRDTAGAAGGGSSLRLGARGRAGGRDPARQRLFELQADLCAALADPTRLEILDLLRDGERTVGQLMAALGLRQNTVSQHLAYLRRAGAVAGERRGTFVHYRVALPGLLEACAAVRAAIGGRLAAQAQEAAALSQALDEGVASRPAHSALPAAASAHRGPPEPRGEPPR